MTRGLLAIEVATQSNSLITAQLATEQKRDVFVIPGSIRSPLVKGCRPLIKQGVKLMETATGILDELGWGRAAAPAKHATRTATVQSPEAASASARMAPSATEVALLGALGFDPVDPDTLCKYTGRATTMLSSQLLALELDSRVECQPGGHSLRLPQKRVYNRHSPFATPLIIQPHSSYHCSRPTPTPLCSTRTLAPGNY